MGVVGHDARRDFSKSLNDIPFRLGIVPGVGPCIGTGAAQQMSSKDSRKTDIGLDAAINRRKVL